MHTDSFLLGAGGHGKVVLDVLLEQGGVPLVLDGDENKVGEVLLGCDIALLPDNLSQLPQQGHVAIGDNATRERMAQRLVAAGYHLLRVSHSAAVVATSANLGVGCFIAAGAIIGPDALVGEGTIVNHNTVIDHDCRVGAYAHLAPGTVLGGEVTIGRRVLVGAGATVLPGVTVGDDVVIGAGTVVTKSLPSGCRVVGIPAREHND
jgi:sugar O-acyltransferase (sialic acid O-acetyltransferase NeuD family)